MMRTTGVPRYHLNSLMLYHKGHKGFISALCDWRSPVHAVTGIPVTVYSAQAFLRHVNSDDFGVVILRMLPPRSRRLASFSIRLRYAYYF
jgi:hypothetical protein